jgi:PASTA domain/IPT/TIG domain
MRRALSVRAGLVAALAVIASIPIGATALAQVTVGQLAPAGTGSCSFSNPYDEIQLSVSSGASYEIPASGGALTSWSVLATAASGQAMGLKVFRPLAGQFQVVAMDGPRPLTPGVVNTFPVSIPVQAGDVIGQVMPAGTSNNVICGFTTDSTGDVFAYEMGNVPVGGTVNFDEPLPKWRLNISATLLPPPVVGAVSPASGSIQGASVVVAGSNFAEVRSVTFGDVPAQSFTVDSEGQITAVSPVSSTLAAVPVSVTTAAGTASSSQLFAYEGCKVPKLKNRTLKAAKKQIRKKDCRVGKVKKLGDATAKTGRVSKQRPKAGQLLPPDAKVKVTLSD